MPGVRPPVLSLFIESQTVHLHTGANCLCWYFLHGRCWQYTCFLRTFRCSALTAKLRCLLTPTGGLWTRLGSTPKTKEKNTKKVDHRPSGAEEDDSELQRAWGALIKEKEQSRQKKSRLDSLPSLQIEVSRESSSGSEAESWCPGLGSCPQIWHSYIGWGT